MILGTWSADDPRRAFVAGVAWYQFQTTGFTMFASERQDAETEADRQYPGGRAAHSEQHMIFRAVAARGYLQNAFSTNILQEVAKLGEEFAELVACLDLTPDPANPEHADRWAQFCKAVQVLGELARDLHDNPNPGARVQVHADAPSELADCAVAMFCAAEVLQTDLLPSARLKAMGDVLRGVRIDDQTTS